MLMLKKQPAKFSVYILTALLFAFNGASARAASIDEATCKRGDAYCKQGQYKKAIEECDKAIKLDPRLALAYYARAEAYMSLPYSSKEAFETHHDWNWNIKKAIEDFTKAISLDPKYAMAYAHRGLAYSRIQKGQLAIDDCSKAIVLDPKNPWFYYIRGLNYPGQQKAIDDFSKTISLDPKDARALVMRGGVYEKLGQHQKADQDFGKAIVVDARGPWAVQAYIDRGQCFAKLGQQQNAIEEYNKAISIDPKDSSAYLNRGNSYRELGQHQNGIADYAKGQFDGDINQAAVTYYGNGIEDHPKAAWAYSGRGESFLKMSDSSLIMGEQSNRARVAWCCKRAIEDFDKAISLKPGDSDVIRLRNVAYNKLDSQHSEYSQSQIDLLAQNAPSLSEDQKKLMEPYDLKIAAHPDAKAYCERGAVYADSLKQPQKAISDYNASIGLDPYYSEAYSLRGITERELGLNEKALKDFTTAIDLDPREQGNFMFRSDLYRKLGQEQKADEDWRTHDSLVPYRTVEYYSHAIAEDPNNIGVYYLLADQLMKSGQYRTALDDLTQVLHLKPGGGQALYLRGQCWEKLRNYQQAITDYTAAIDLDPSGAQARRWCNFSERGLVYMARGDVYRLLGNQQKVIDDYTTAINLDNPVIDILPFMWRASAYGEIERYSEALSDYTAAIKLAPQNPLLYLMRANIYDRFHQCDKALGDCDTAIGIMRGEDFQHSTILGNPQQNLAKAYSQRELIAKKLRNRNSAFTHF